jgi:hypothetical protein
MDDGNGGGDCLDSLDNDTPHCAVDDQIVMGCNGAVTCQISKFERTDQERFMLKKNDEGWEKFDGSLTNS